MKTRCFVAAGKPLIFLTASIALATIVWAAGFDRQIAGGFLQLGVGGAFLAGLFYTAGFTTPTAMMVILDLMSLENPFAVAVAAAFGAAVADSILFYLLKKSLEKSASKLLRRIRGRIGRFRGLLFAAGFLVFGSPFPDEVAIALMEITKIRVLRLAAAVFAAKLATLLFAHGLLGL